MNIRGYCGPSATVLDRPSEGGIIPPVEWGRMLVALRNGSTPVSPSALRLFRDRTTSVGVANKSPPLTRVYRPRRPQSRAVSDSVQRDRSACLSDALNEFN
ncbi:unnamed protein product, partial [Iphiclides podalirius]